jgi:toxin-antitoxin system PIN domain toxin
MTAVDANILIYGAHEQSPWHRTARDLLTELAEGKGDWAIPWPCVHEFLSISTNRKIYQPPLKMETAFAVIEHWMKSPTLRLIGESGGHWAELKALATAGRVAGPIIHDTRIAAICRQHGVTEFWTADRDFARFPTLNAVNPLIKK